MQNKTTPGGKMFKLACQAIKKAMCNSCMYLGIAYGITLS